MAADGEGGTCRQRDDGENRDINFFFCRRPASVRFSLLYFTLFFSFLRCSCPSRFSLTLFWFSRMVTSVAGTVGGTGIERIKGTDKEGLLDVNRIDRCAPATCVELHAPLPVMYPLRSLLLVCTPPQSTGVTPPISTVVSHGTEERSISIGIDSCSRLTSSRILVPAWYPTQHT